MATAIGAYATASAFKTRAGITGTDDDTLIGTLCDQINQYIESCTLQPIAPITSAAYLYDGNGLTRIYLPIPVAAATMGVGGARAVTLLEIASETGGTFETITSTDYFLRDRDGVLGPYRYLCLSDQIAGNFSTFPEGRGNVRVTMTAGWAAIPDDLTEMALNTVHMAWNLRESGQQNVTNTDELGRPFMARFLNSRDHDTLKHYKLRMPY